MEEQQEIIADNKSSETTTEYKKDAQARRFSITINNPTQSDLEIKEYIESLEHIKYFIFQREKGHETGTEHIQGFIVFSIAKRFSTIKQYFPTAHIEKCKGSNTQCRDYCSKTDTRIAGPYEYGQFAEERARTDYKEFLELAQGGISDTELSNLFPTLYMKHIGNLEKIRESFRHDKYCDLIRDVDVTYIYGPPRTGKTYSVVKEYGLRNIHLIRIYGTGMFDSYSGQDVMVFDEFNSQVKITEMNAYLDRYAVELKARFYNRQASYTKVYIIANIPLSAQYKEEQEDSVKKEIYTAFCERIKTIIRFDKQGNQFIEKSPIKTEQTKIEN